MTGAIGQEWKLSGLCAQTDPEVFFPEKGGSTGEAKRICGGCEVRSECLQYALATGEHFGVWGGLSERERRQLRRGERPALRPATPKQRRLTANYAPIPDLTPAERQRFTAKLEPRGAGCLVWTGKVDRQGRGTVQFTRDHRGLSRLAHRVAFHLARGRQPSGQVLRTCGDMLCCAPGHLVDDRTLAEAA